MKEIHDVVIKVKQRGRAYEAYLKTHTNDSIVDWYQEYIQHWRDERCNIEVYR